MESMLYASGWPLLQADIGANFHFGAVGEDCTEENVHKFDAFTSDLHRMAHWLSEHHVQTVVMESTGFTGSLRSRFWSNEDRK